MRRSTPLLALAVLALPGASALAQAAASAAASSPAITAANAAEACERGVRQSLASRAGPAAELKFAAAPAVQPGLSNGGQLVMQGAGSWRAAGGTLRRFEYSCNLNPRNSEAVGVLIRDLTSAAAEAAAPHEVIEPDLTNLSPTACESAAAVALKKRWPAVSQLNFDSATRRLSQESPSKASLRGQGKALPAPGSPLTHFEFDCELDPRDGRVVGMRVSS